LFFVHTKMDTTQRQPDYQRRFDHKVIGAIIIFSLLRICIAGILELGNDETYYWLYSQQLQWNYFDHPPMVAFGIRLFTFNLVLDEYEIFVRLSSIAGCALSSWFMYKAVCLIANHRAGWFAVILYNVSFYAGIIAGLLVMPDSPQLVCWTFSLWMIAKIARNDRQWKPWLLLGIAAGLCIMSKIHGAFIWIGLGLFILTKKRDWLTRPQLYSAVLLTLLLVSPLLIWNWQYDFITWRFHSERVNIAEAAERKDNFVMAFFGQILVSNPVNFCLIALTLFTTWKIRKSQPVALTIYNFIALPFIVLLIFISVFRDIWAHWSGPAYITLLPAAAIWLDKYKEPAMHQRWLRWAAGLFLLFLLAWPLTVHFYPGTFGNKNNRQLGEGDITLDKYGWQDAGKTFIDLYTAEQQQGLMPAGSPVVCSNWWGAHLEYYFCRQGDIPVIGLGNIKELHQYAWLNKHREDETNMGAAYAIISSIEKVEIPAVFRNYYQQMSLITTIPVYRNKKIVQYFYVYRLSGWKEKPLPLPHKKNIFPST
jgi:hypothetical protein